MIVFLTGIDQLLQLLCNNALVPQGSVVCHDIYVLTELRKQIRKDHELGTSAADDHIALHARSSQGL